MVVILKQKAVEILEGFSSSLTSNQDSPVNVLLIVSSSATAVTQNKCSAKEVKLVFNIIGLVNCLKIAHVS